MGCQLETSPLIGEVKMALNRKKATGVVKKETDSDYNWENLDKGSHEGRLVYVADLGLQEKNYKGEFQGNFQQISLGIEVIGQGMDDKDGVLQPRILWTKPFNVYENGLTENGIELEYYSVFDTDADENTDPDWEAQLDKVCSVNVINVEGTGANKDKTYDNIKSLDKIPEKYQKDVEGSTVKCAIGDSEDKDNLVTKGLFGLPKFVWEKRIVEEPKSGDVVEEKVVDGVVEEIKAPY